MLNQAEIHGMGMKETLAAYFQDPLWPRISARAFAAWVALLIRNIAFVDIASASYRELAQMTGLARETVSRAVAELIRKGYIQRLDPGRARNVPSCYRMLRVAEIQPVNGGNFRKHKLFGRAINQTLDHVFAEEARKSAHRDLKAAGFTDEMLEPVDAGKFLQTLEPVDTGKFLQDLGPVDVGKFLQSFEDKNP